MALPKAAHAAASSALHDVYLALARIGVIGQLAMCAANEEPRVPRRSNYGIEPTAIIDGMARHENAAREGHGEKAASAGSCGNLIPRCAYVK